MRLSRLQIKNHGALRDVDLDLRALRVALFVGTNGAGKSTVADSIAFALTNAARGKSASTVRDLTTWGEKAMKVAVTVQRDPTSVEFVVGRTPSSCDVSQGAIVERLGIRSIDALSCSFDAMRFLGMDVAARKAFMLRVGGVSLDEAALRAAGVDDADVIAIALKRGVKAAETAAAEAKRQANRDAEAARRPEPEDVEVPVVGGTKRLSTLDPDAGAAVVAGRRAARDQAQRDLSVAERALEDAKRSGERVQAAEVAVATARADLAAVEARLGKAAGGRPSAAALRDQAERCLPATREEPPARPAAPERAAAPSTEAGQAARIALDAAKAVAERAQWRATEARRIAVGARTAVEDAERGAWPEVLALCKQLETYGFECQAGPLRLAVPFTRIQALAKENGPDLVALRAAHDDSLAAHEKSAREADEASEAVARAHTALDAAAAAYRAAKAEADAEDAGRAKAHADAVAVWEKRLAERNARVKAAEDERRRLLGEAATVERLEEADARALRDAQGSLRGAQAHLDGVKAAAAAAPVGDPAELRARIARLDAELEVIEDAARRAAAYRAEARAYAEAKARVDHLVLAAARYERMERALRPEGAVGRLAAGPLAVVREVLAKIDPGVVLTDEYEVVIDHHEQGAANTARQWLAGAYLSIALSAAAGTRFVVLDGLGVVVEPDEVNRLLKALLSVEQFDQAFVMVSRPAAAVVKPYSDPRVGVFRVADGVVTRVTAAPAATAAA